MNNDPLAISYPATLQYLYSQLPMFTRVGASAIKNNLDNTIALCHMLGNPQHRFKSIHVGGTNGKGSVSHMLAAILQTAGYKTGLYTSPHLKDFRERIRINGQMITQQTVVDFVATHKADFEKIQPSFFEMTVALAFDLFAKEKVDIAIVEVGLGGRLDSTNILSPLLSVITNIGWDHMNLLGDTLPKIAAEKAGIIKPLTPVIISERHLEVDQVFTDKAAEVNAPIVFAADEWEITEELVADGELVTDWQGYYQKTVSAVNHSTNTVLQLQTDLTGTYQLKNIKAVLAAVGVLRQQGYTITKQHLISGLRQVKSLTGLHGRWEIISTAPLTICDTGHNPDGMREVLQNIARIKYNRLHFVIGMVNDKDIDKVLYMLPAHALYYFCKPDIPRGLDAENLQQKATGFTLQGNAYPSVDAALQAAKHNAGNNDLVFVGGSTFVVAEVISDF